ncbi:MAG: DNA-binding response regulator [Bdellovibrionaceae bacterium]|nr:DNA-binding response regulator [Pseudobdellovibrionaceae bacterium]
MSGQRIVIIDDDTSLRTALFRALDRKGFQVVTANSCREGEALAQSQAQLDLALIDLRLPDGNGIELMSRMKKLQPQMQSIILTGFGTIETAVDATQKGAFHFITKPFNLDEILSIIDKAISHSSLERENLQLKQALHTKYRFGNIVGQSEAIQNVLSMVEKIADSESTTLVTGESGTGKELIAKALHYNSGRANKPFVPINCGAIPAELLESELFGHIKGAFTGAINNRMGRFEMANGGTLFLDEIGDMSPTLQVKLLRVLQERRIEPVGSTKSIEVDVRVVAATNINLEEAVEQGRFREDLFYRLNVIPIHIPPLRERRSDIPLLFHHFMEVYNSSRNRNLSGISNDALEQLYNHDWPGNIRELENLVERITILRGEGEVRLIDLPDKYRKNNRTSVVSAAEIPETGMDFNSAVDAYENSLILKALEKTGWNRNQAAILLKLNRTTLVEKIKKKGLQPPTANA